MGDRDLGRRDRCHVHRGVLVTRLLALLVAACACEPAPPISPIVSMASVAPVPTTGDACQVDIPDCEAACAMRESHRTQHLEWFDRRCAAVVLGKSPDKAVATDADGGVAPAATAKRPDCDTPFYYDPTGVKKWKLSCVD